MSRKIFSVVAAAVLVTGCASVPESPSVPAATGPAGGEEKLIPIEVEKKFATLSPDLLFLILTAEIAGQRGHIDLALEGYMEAVKLAQDPAVAERATQIALFAKDADNALEAVQLWVARDPENISARKVASMIFLQRGEAEQAAQHLKVLLDSGEVDAEDVWLEVVKVLDKDVKDAIAVMGRLLTALPGWPEAHYSYALLATDLQASKLALTEVQKALELRPDWIKAKVLQAQIVAESGDPEQARRLLESALENEPDNAQLRIIYAQFLVRQADYPAAEHEFEQILSADPTRHDALYALALVKLQLKQTAAAKPLFLKLLDVPKWQKQAYLQLGRIALSDGDLDTALAWFDRVPPGPFFLEAQMSALSALARQGRSDEAVMRLGVLRDRFPGQSLRFYLMEAELLNTQQDYAGAYEALDRALEELPDQTELLYARALAAERLDRLDVLEADLKQLLSISPDDANALNALGYTLVDRTDRYQEARGYLERAIALRPEDPVIIDSYGWLHFKLGDYGRALELLQKAYDRDQDPEIAAHLIEVFWVLGKKQEAEALLESTLNAYPGNEYIEGVRQRLFDGGS